MGEGASPLTRSRRPDRPHLAVIALALLVVPGPGDGAAAQEPDSVALQPQDTSAIAAADSLALADSLAQAADTVAVDTVVVRFFPLFPAPASRRPGVMFRWTNADILNTGALTLGDLLEILPDPDPVRAGFLEGPQTSVFAGGGPASFRLSIEGYEIVPMGGGAFDQHQVDLVSQGGARLIRAPGGTQLVVETFRNSRPDAYSRIEAGTGDRNANLLRGYFSAWAAGNLIGFGLDRVDTRGLPDLGQSERTVVYGSLARELPAKIWGQVEVRSTTINRDNFPSPRRTDWIARLRREFGAGWFADVVAGTGSVTERQVVPAGEPDSLFPDLKFDVQQLAVRGARVASRYQATALVRVWGGGGVVPNLESEASLELEVGPLSFYGAGSYSTWDAFDAAAAYAAARLQLPLGLRLLAEVEEGDRGLYYAVPLAREEFSRWTVGGELEIGSWTLGAQGGRWRVQPSPAIGVPWDTGGALPGGTVGIVEGWANGKLFELFGGAITAAARYRTRDPGFFLYWPQDEWQAEGKYHLRMFGDQLEIILRTVGGIRGPMRVPAPTGGALDAVVSTPDLSWLWSEAVVRVRDARLFFSYEIFDSELGAQDLPGFGLPRARTHFGLKWEFWN